MHHLLNYSTSNWRVVRLIPPAVGTTGSFCSKYIDKTLIYISLLSNLMAASSYSLIESLPRFFINLNAIEFTKRQDGSSLLRAQLRAKSSREKETA